MSHIDTCFETLFSNITWFVARLTHVYELRSEIYCMNEPKVCTEFMSSIQTQRGLCGKTINKVTFQL